MISRTERTAQRAFSLPNLLAATALLLQALWINSLCVSAQPLAQRVTETGSTLLLTEPTSIAVSPNGVEIAITDEATDRITVINLKGEVVKVLGEQVLIRAPRACYFKDERTIGFVSRGSSTICLVAIDNPGRLDTLATLTAVGGKVPSPRHIIVTAQRDFLVLDERNNRILAFDHDWNAAESPVVASGRGRGKLRDPSGLVLLGDNRIVISDFRNQPGQIFTRQGKYLMSLGWNDPLGQETWQASAVALDSRDIIWMADATNRQFRLFDQAGTQMKAVQYPEGLFRPIVMTGTIDNRMLVVGETGRVFFYELQ